MVLWTDLETVRSKPSGDLSVFVGFYCVAPFCNWEHVIQSFESSLA